MRTRRAKVVPMRPRRKLSRAQRRAIEDARGAANYILSLLGYIVTAEPIAVDNWPPPQR